ncbi:MAG: nucleotide-binding protein [Thermofilum sp. ex4484_79]|nr:MAG: nucleotide-binding protein [Thermofilum sp. ex4484_79]
MQRKKTLRVLFDTNFLLLPARYNLNIIEGIADLLNSPYEPVVLYSTIRELRKLAERGGKIGRFSRLALKICEKLVILNDAEIEGDVDQKIVELATKLGLIVATNDVELRRKLREKGVSVIFFREKDRRLDIEGDPYYNK